MATLAATDGGTTVACLGMARAVARRGHAVTIFTTDIGLTAAEARRYATDGAGDGVTVRVFPGRWPRGWRHSPALARALATAMPEQDIVHLHSLYLHHDLAVARACRAAGRPYLLQPHGSLDPFIWQRSRAKKRLVELAYQDRVTAGAAALLYTAEEERLLAQPYAHGVPGAVVPLGVDTAGFDTLPPAATFRARHPEIGGRRIVLLFGRLNFKKGLDILARAWGRVVVDRPDAWLVLAGPDDGMADNAARWLAEAGVADRATFTGMLRGDDRLAALAAADLFVLPSYSENFGIAVVEAMACGLPVLISDKVNIWREVAAAGAGAVTPAATEPFAARLAALLADPAELAAMGRRAHAFARENYDWALVAGRLEAVYAALARGDPPPGPA